MVVYNSAQPANKLVQPYLLRNYDRNGHKTCPLYIYKKKVEFDKFFIVIAFAMAKRNGLKAKLKMLLRKNERHKKKVKQQTTTGIKITFC